MRLSEAVEVLVQEKLVRRLTAEEFAGSFDCSQKAEKGGYGSFQVCRIVHPMDGWYDGWHYHEDGKVGIKTLLEKQRQVKNPRDLIRSLYLARGLNFAAVMRTYGVVAVDSSLRFAVEYVDGVNGAEYAKIRPPPARQGAWGIMCLMAQLLAGLLYIHSMGLVHRDLKPANVVITLAEPGLARAVLIDTDTVCTPFLPKGRITQGTCQTFVHTPEYLDISIAQFIVEHGGEGGNILLPTQPAARSQLHQVLVEWDTFDAGVVILELFFPASAWKKHRKAFREISEDDRGSLDMVALAKLAAFRQVPGPFVDPVGPGLQPIMDIIGGLVEQPRRRLTIQQALDRLGALMLQAPEAFGGAREPWAAYNARLLRLGGKLRLLQRRGRRDPYFGKRRPGRPEAFFTEMLGLAEVGEVHRGLLLVQYDRLRRSNPAINLGSTLWLGLAIPLFPAEPQYGLAFLRGLAERGVEFVALNQGEQEAQAVLMHRSRDEPGIPLHAFHIVQDPGEAKFCISPVRVGYAIFEVAGSKPFELGSDFFAFDEFVPILGLFLPHFALQPPPA